MQGKMQKMIKKIRGKIYPSVFLFLTACSTQSPEGSIGDGCVGVPQGVVYCGLSWIAIGTLLGLFCPRIPASIIAAFLNIENDYNASVDTWTSFGRLGGVLGIIALACYFIFLYPDSQSIISGADPCSFIVNP